jgi:predicted nucleic acid-binding protein
MSVRFLLDTNICIYIAKRRPPEVASRFESMRPGDVGMSIITYGEQQSSGICSGYRACNRKLGPLKRTAIESSR